MSLGRGLLRLGAAFTIVWIGLMVGFLFAKSGELHELKLNEIGDMLAGGFAPLAFSWVVVTVFLQHRGLEKQGEELKDFTKILSTQAKHLEESATQLRAAVERGDAETRARLIHDLSRHAVHLMHLAADLTKNARIEMAGGDGLHNEPGLFGSGELLLSYFERDEIETAVAMFVEGLDRTTDALSVRQGVIKWAGDVVTLQSRLGALRTKVREIRKLAEGIGSSAAFVLPSPQFGALDDALGRFAPFAASWASRDT